MSKGLDMLRDYIEHDALCMCRLKCCDIEDEIIQEMDALKAENEKLRKLADAVKEFVEDSPCEDCLCRRECYDNNRILCANTFSYHAFAAMRKLEIEVNG